MTSPNESAFESIESAQDFVALLGEVIAETKKEIEAEVKRESTLPRSRRMDALRIAAYDLRTLEQHICKSRRILNDLRTLRRLMLQERQAKVSQPQADAAVIDEVIAPHRDNAGRICPHRPRSIANIEPCALLPPESSAGKRQMALREPAYRVP